GHPKPDSLLTQALTRMHNDAVLRFGNTQGFGGGRMGGFASPQKVVKEWKVPWWSPGELTEEKTVDGEMDLSVIHNESLSDFADDHAGDATKAPTNIGHAAQKQKTWELKSLDLVGLMKHPQPLAYISEKIDVDMDKLKALPTRSLDYFELAGVEELRA